MSFPKALWTRLFSNSQWLKNTNGDINISHNNHQHIISYSLFLPLNNAPGICLVLWGGENQIIFCNIHVFVFNTSINQSFVGLFNPFTGKTEGFPSLDESANSIWSLNKKPRRRKGSKPSKALCFFSRGNHARVHKKAKLATWKPRIVFNALAKENKSQSSVRSSKNLQEKLMGSSSQCSFLLLEMTTNTVPHETISSWLQESPGGGAERTLAFIHSFLQGLIDRGIGVESRGAGLHEFGRIMWGHRTQSAGGCSVGDAGHDCHHLCNLLFEVLDFLILLQDLPCGQQSTALRVTALLHPPGAPNVPFCSLASLKSQPV